MGFVEGMSGLIESRMREVASVSDVFIYHAHIATSVRLSFHYWLPSLKWQEGDVGCRLVGCIVMVTAATFLS